MFCSDLPPPADVRVLDTLNSLRADVGALSGDLKTVNGKLQVIMSLLSDVADDQNGAASNNTSHGADVGGGGGGCSGFRGGNVAGSAAVPTEVGYGCTVGVAGWVGGGGKSDGGMHGEGEDWDVGGAPRGHFVEQGVPMCRQEQGSGSNAFCPPPSWTAPSSTRPYPVGPHQAGDQIHDARSVTVATSSCCSESCGVPWCYRPCLSDVFTS